MDEFDDIEDLYHGMLNEFTGKPNERSWARLENNLNIEDFGVENWYKNKVESLNKVPHAEVWEVLSQKFDTESVWERIAISLRKRDRIIWWWQFSMGSLTLLLAAFIILTPNYRNIPVSELSEKKNIIEEPITTSNETLLVEKEHSKTIIERELENIGQTESIYKPEIVNSVKEVEKPTRNISIIDKKERQNASTEVVDLVNQGNNKDNTNKPYITVNLNEELVNLSDEENENTKQSENDEISNITVSEGIAPEKNELIKQPTIPPVYMCTDIAITDNFLNKIPVHFDSTLNNFTTQNDYFYVEASVVNPWLMNSDTYHSFRKNSNDYNQISLTGGFAVGYVHWFEKFGLESNVSFKSKGHNYTVYIEGRTYEKKINLDYIDASIQIKKCISKDKITQWKSYLSGGIYYGRSIQQNFVFNGVSYGNLATYSKNDLGLTLSYEKILNAKNKNISLGLSFSQGLINIYRGNSYMDFNKTYNFAVSGSIKYLFLLEK